MERGQSLRVLEAILFASSEPVSEKMLVERLPDNEDLLGLLSELQAVYVSRGINLVHIGDSWTFRTAPDLAFALRQEEIVSRRLSRAAVETLGIIAYHQPITRSEIEEMRGVSLGQGTLDILLELAWVKPMGRRRTPGRPITWGTSKEFLSEFGLESIEALPSLEELKSAGLLERRPVWNASSSNDLKELEADFSGDKEVTE